jgi:hypothetical protein
VAGIVLWSCIPGVDMCCGICLFAAVFIAVKAATHEEPPKHENGKT